MDCADGFRGRCKIATEQVPEIQVSEEANGHSPVPCLKKPPQPAKMNFGRAWTDEYIIPWLVDETAIGEATECDADDENEIDGFVPLFNRKTKKRVRFDIDRIKESLLDEEPAADTDEAATGPPAKPVERRRRSSSGGNPRICKICLDYLEGTRVLPCGHRFCNCCLQQHSMGSNTPRCPYCRKAHPLDESAQALNHASKKQPKQPRHLKHRILVFGSSNVGKTSLLNTLTRSSRPTGDGAMGTTMGIEEFPEIRFGDKSFVFLDTAGLDESNRGMVPAKNAAAELLNFIKSSHNGLSLLVYVFTQGSATEQLTNNYDLFYKVIASERIPIIAAVTYCENFETDLNEWAEQHQSILAERYGLRFAQVVGCCFATGGRGISEQFAKICEPLREISRTRLLEAIASHVTASPVRIFHPTIDGMTTWVRNVWNFLVQSIAPESADALIMINKLYYKLLLAVGFSPQEAKKEALWLETERSSSSTSS